MWGLLALIAPGFAEMPLADATATCLQGQPRGSLDPNRPDRQLAFAEVVRNLLDVPTEARIELLGTPLGTPWPTQPIDADYAPKVALAQPWVAEACLAAGQHWIDVGAELHATCAADPKACRAAFTETERDIVKAAQKAERKGDGFWATLASFDDALTTWQDPVPFLERACALPEQAAADSRFVDTSDLRAARLACVQLVALAQLGLPETLPLACETPWRETAADRDAIRQPGTDLGYADATAALEHLRQMDPAPVPCAGDLWRTGLPMAWRNGQATRACVDPELPMLDRRHLCPDLQGRLTSGCDEADVASCYALGRMTLVGLDVPMDERAGLHLLARACEGGHEGGCSDLASYADVVTGWIAPLLEDEPSEEALREALAVVERFELGLGEAWAQERIAALVEAAQRARLRELKEELQRRITSPPSSPH